MNRATLGLIFGLVILAYGCTDSKEVQMVKNGELQLCDGATIEQMAKSFMGSPSWVSGKGKDGMAFVNVSGDVFFQEKSVKATLQFEVDKKNDSFAYRSLEMNGVPQNDIVALILIGKMCESAIEKYLEFDRMALTDIRNAKTAAEAYMVDHQQYPERLEQMEFAASDGVRCDYKRMSNAEYVLSAYHEMGSKRFTAGGETAEIKQERR